MPKVVDTTPPSQVATAEERGQMLRHLISLTHKSAGVFAKEAGMSRSTLNALLTGRNDPALVLPKTAEAIACALGMPDSFIHDKLGLSVSARRTWSTRRPAPHGAGHRETVRRQELRRPIMGEVVLPAGAVLIIDTEEKHSGIQILRLNTGEFFSMKAGTAAVGESIGQLVGVEFATSPRDPEPS